MKHKIKVNNLGIVIKGLKKNFNTPNGKITAVDNFSLKMYKDQVWYFFLFLYLDFISFLISLKFWNVQAKKKPKQIFPFTGDIFAGTQWCW